MRRIALALNHTNVKVGEDTHTVCCREQIVTLADHYWRAPNTSYFSNQTQIADEMETQRICSPQFDTQMMQINPLEVM
jgi:hypothetical protein